MPPIPRKILKSGRKIRPEHHTPLAVQKLPSREGKIRKGINSKAKGNRWELEVCKRLSLWLSKGERSDLFSRNVSSGAMFTNARRLGADLNMPGDIAAAHPTAANFAQLFCVECKAVHDLQFLSFVTGNKKLDNNWLGRVILKAKDEGEAATPQRSWMVLAKQNGRPPIALMPIGLLKGAEVMAKPRGLVYASDLWGVGVCPMDDFLSFVDGGLFVSYVESYIESRRKTV